ncbi:MAG: DUF3800 domain-containing protein [Alphaproteobacteria bacterium]
MKFEVYCDEALPDLFTSQRPRARYLMIGSLWLPAEMRDEVKARIAALRADHAVWGEMKWTKISPSKQAFYEELIDVFMSFGMDMRFRCIAVDREQVNLALHQNDGELGFYKFYYQLLHHWILDFNEYRIFCDLKTNRDRKRLHDLQRCLHYSNLSATITDIQSLPSPEVVLLQLCDVLLGAASSRLNDTLGQGTAKEAVVRKLEERLSIHGRIGPTRRTEEKFNVFRIRLDGGW